MMPNPWLDTSGMPNLVRTLPYHPLNLAARRCDQRLSGPESLGRFQQESAMSTKTKFAAAALVALTLGATAIASTSEAQAHGWGWGGFGVGIAAGALLGAAAASTPTFVVTSGFRRCHLAPRYNVYGYYIGSTRVCSYY
jgi:hypothetical protein